MQDRLRSFDWSRTELGPMEGWPQSLRIAVCICMDSRFPMFVWWGPNRINIYNDAYIPILGAKHPAAFGEPAEPPWKEIWDVVGPQADAVMQGGEATWNERALLVMRREVEGQGFFEIMDRVYGTGEPYVGQGVRMMLRRKDGKGLEPRFLDFVYQPLRGPDGAVTGILAHGNDVSHRHEIEHPLRRHDGQCRWHLGHALEAE